MDFVIASLLERETSTASPDIRSRNDVEKNLLTTVTRKRGM